MEEILAEYNKLLSLIDEWFARCMERYPDKIACGTGCSSCCRGLFDITLLDALFLKRGFDALSPEVKGRVLAKCGERLGLMREEWPELAHPFLLNHRPDEDWEALMPDEDETPCVLLDGDGRCLVYDNRPMTCRLHGIPFVDTSGDVMHDEWCTMNFTETDPLSLPGISAPFDAIFRQEVALFRQLTSELVGERVQELDTFIPLALMIDFDNFDWPGWFADFRPCNNESEE
ncbi:YkgJ family cysteine cluster protein [Geomonas sp. Red32]|uniref:YkgJ family cysteine cluster protein n=1 Tax=Geomonas sp. Red32 TaxID=2912856 RepID=UPI00202CF5BE|nr:YkgJ family cysteine cluster protein [Geomonas sp. Red32]MCM0083066.1 YkgJ family cysteine cluster protein [Geomonas sp. Red32]